MARKSTATASAASAHVQTGESTAGYFRRVFEENPGWLKTRSNDKVLQKWLVDHAGEKEVPQSVKKGMAKIKGILRSKKRRKVARTAEATRPNGQMVQQGQAVSSAPPVKVARVASGGSKLEALELQIDECLISARHLDKEGLHDVIAMLRKARNTVVWKLGQ